LDSFSIRKALIDSVDDLNFPIKSVLVGEHLTAVETRSLGISATLRNNSDTNQISEAKNKNEHLTTAGLLQLLNSESCAESSIGLACLNSLIKKPDKYFISNAFTLIQDMSASKKIGLIGRFPFSAALMKQGAKCYIFEFDPHGDELPADSIPHYLPQCDIVIITGQTISNGTIDHVLKYATAAYKILLGPSAPLSSVLFDFGIDMIGGAWVRDAEQVKYHIASGASFRHLPGIELLTMMR